MSIPWSFITLMNVLPCCNASRVSASLSANNGIPLGITLLVGAKEEDTGNEEDVGKDADEEDNMFVIGALIFRMCFNSICLVYENFVLKMSRLREFFLKMSRLREFLDSTNRNIQNVSFTRIFFFFVSFTRIFFFFVSFTRIFFKNVSFTIITLKKKMFFLTQIYWSQLQVCRHILSSLTASGRWALQTHRSFDKKKK